MHIAWSQLAHLFRRDPGRTLAAMPGRVLPPEHDRPALGALAAAKSTYRNSLTRILRLDCLLRIIKG